MKLTRIGCQGYRPFRDAQNASLRPLTILFGRNSSGKTALLRLPKLLLRCLSSRVDQGFPLQVDDVCFGSSFRSLVHRKQTHGQLSLLAAVEDEDGNQQEIKATIQHLCDHFGKEDLVVSRLELSNPAILLEWEGTAAKPARYVAAGPLVFSGLLPDASVESSLSPAVMEALDRLRRKVRSLEMATSHIGSQRASVAPVHQKNSERSLGSVGIDGTGAMALLAENADLAEAVGEWYAEHMEGWRLDLMQQGTACSCILRRNATTVNLAEAGQGMQQVFPVVVQQLAHRWSSERSFLDLVEEPELHLHPAAHAALADLFLGSAKSGTGQIIVETHSENFLLRIRRRIAEGADPRLVAVYWIEDMEDGSSTVKQVSILEDGSVDFWPQDVFSEDYHEVRALRRAARIRLLEASS